MKSRTEHSPAYPSDNYDQKVAVKSRNDKIKNQTANEQHPQQSGQPISSNSYQPTSFMDTLSRKLQHNIKEKNVSQNEREG